MPRWQRAYVIAAFAVIGAVFAYAACDWARWPRLTYLPVAGEWTLSAPAGAVAVTYLGVVLWGAGGLCTGAILGAVVCRAWNKPLSDRMIALVGAWSITAVLLVGAYYTWSMWPW